jgi:hypothetical protein
MVGNSRTCPGQARFPRFCYQYFHRVLSHHNNEKRLELFPPDSLQWTLPLALALCQALPVSGLSGDAMLHDMPCTA